MNKKLNTYLTIFLSMVLVQTISLSQIKIHKSITAEEGLVQGQVSAMIQDSKGYLWFGTYDGVSKWDGNHFSNIQTQNGLPAAQVTDIKEGHDGKVYIATFRGGILVISDGELDTLNEDDGLVTNAVTHINVQKNGEILFGGLNGRISKLVDGKIENWSEKIKFPNSPAHVVWDSYEDKNGILYFATQNGLMIYDGDSLKNLTVKDGLNHNILRSVNGDKDGTIYIGSYKGVNKIKDGKISSLDYNGNRLSPFVVRTLIAKDGTVYYATSEGIIKENNGHIELITEDNGLIFNDCWSVLEDNNGTIYFGSNGKGVNIYNPNEPIINFNKRTGLNHESVWAIHEDKSGKFYFGTVGGLIINEKNKSSLIKKEDGLTGNFIREIFEDRDGRILLATNSGLNILQNNRIKTFTMQNGLLANQIHALAQLKTGEILLGTQNGVSILINDICDVAKSNLITKGVIEGLKVSNIQTIIVSKTDEMIFGTFNGIAIYKKKEFSYLTVENGLIDNVINTMYEGADGLIYAGTFKGINIIKNGEVIDTIDVNDGLSNNAIADILEDKSGQIFVSTFYGLNILQYNNDSLLIRSLYKKDGLADNDFTQEGSFIDKSGNVWLGTLYGVSKYNPSADFPILNPPNIYINDIEIFNKKYPLEELEISKELNYNQNYIKFIYSGINLSAPQKIIYKYRLTGVDKDWVSSKEQYVQYTNLDDGNFLFEVKARNEWGYWSKPTILSFGITPAWYKTWWFRLLVLSTIGFLIWLVFQYRLNYLLKLERLRTKIASDLHDEVGSLLTQISINVDSLSYTNDEVKRMEKNSFIRSKSSEVINMMSDVIWSIDARNDNLESLVDRIHNFALTFLEQKDILLDFDNQIENLDKNLKIDFRQNVLLIAKEAVNNSVKYSDCSKIKIVISNKKNIFEMIISDNGKGIDFDNIKRGNGLDNMKMRAELINANLNFSSNDGCTIHLIKKKL
ncbi:MAG: hypothetical protein GY936_11830 [Ignavibacteriae bacterium]|nr:hypothetical protein [Ignavibacteriota bacterium]